MNFKEDIEEVQNDIRQVSFAFNVLEDYKAAFKRLFLVLVLVLFLWVSTLGYLMYVLNNYGTEEITEITDTEGEGNACIGDSCNNGVIYGEGN